MRWWWQGQGGDRRTGKSRPDAHTFLPRGGWQPWRRTPATRCVWGRPPQENATRTEAGRQAVGMTQELSLPSPPFTSRQGEIYCPADLLTKKCRSPPSSTRIKSLVTAVADLQQAQEFRTEIRTRPSVLWENRQNRPSDRKVFPSESFFKCGFLHLPTLRKALKALTDISALRDQQQLLLRYVLGCRYPLHQNHIYADLLYWFGAVPPSTE